MLLKSLPIVSLPGRLVCAPEISQMLLCLKLEITDEKMQW